VVPGRSLEFADYLLDPSGYGQSEFPSPQGGGGTVRREGGGWLCHQFNDSVTVDWQFTRRKASEKFDYKRNNITRLKT
jgi:hypothetical protein